MSAAVTRSLTEQLLWISGGLALIWTLSMPLSVAIAEATLWLSAALWAVAWLRRELASNGRGAQAAAAPGPAGDALGLVGAPIIVFFAVSLLSAALSRDSVASVLELREVFLFAAPLVTWAAFREAAARDRGRLMFGIGIFACTVMGLAQTFVHFGDEMFRPTGFLGHWMTFSGMLLIGVPPLLTIRGGVRRYAAQAAAVLAVGMIALTMTRSAWVGCAVALVVFFTSGRVRGLEPSETAQPPRLRPALYGMALLIGIVIVALLVGAIAGPDALFNRAASIFSMNAPTNVDRLAMAATGLRIIRAYPYFGIGPGLVGEVYAAWAVDWGVRDDNPHLHNNIIQIAAERGLVGLAAWLWMMAALLVVAWRVLRAVGPDGEGGPEARAALAALLGFLAMGMFEYNFSDSEVLMALLYVVSLPLAASAGMGRKT